MEQNNNNTIKISLAQSFTLNKRKYYFSPLVFLVILHKKFHRNHTIHAKNEKLSSESPTNSCLSSSSAESYNEKQVLSTSKVYIENKTFS